MTDREAEATRACINLLAFSLICVALTVVLMFVAGEFGK